MSTPNAAATSQASRATHARRLRRALIGLAATAFIVVGLIGTYRYVWTFWLYRGYNAPATPRHVTLTIDGRRQVIAVSPGKLLHITVQSPALGGFKVPVIVYLPPGYYDQPKRYYPTFYLLHGYPGGPQSFVNVANVQGQEATLVSEHKMQPMILVMPSGTRSFFVDDEWVNGVQPHDNWATFVARDLVHAIDRRFRAIPHGSARAIGGDSEGGYGALNIDFHNVGEFDVLESWSGYMKADHTPALFAHSNARIAQNSPALTLSAVHGALVSTHTYIWMYSGTHDFSAGESRVFARQLAAFHVAYAFHIFTGRHNWSLWRKVVPTALVTASEHLSHGA